MRSTRSFVALFSILLAAAACAGKTGDQGPQGDPGPTGPPGTPAETNGTVDGTITDGVTGAPLAGVTVSLADSGGNVLTSQVTAADGGFSITMTAGLFELTLAKDYYTPPAPIPVAVNPGLKVSIAAAMSESASGKPSVTLSATGGDFGYGASVPVNASAADPNGDTLTYTWSNATSPSLGSVTGTDTVGTVTMPTLAAAFAPRANPSNPGLFISGYAIEDRFGVLPVIGDTRGTVTAKVTVADGKGQSASATLSLDAASVFDGGHAVAPGTRVYLNSGHADPSAWTIVTKPATSNATLDDPTIRTPSFVPDTIGTYTFAEGANQLSITAGTYMGIITGGSGNSITVDATCQSCHNDTFMPDKVTPWMGTKHATTFVNGLNGGFGPHFSGACENCHTTAYDIGVANGGFDDAAAITGWKFPSTAQAGNWDEMIADAPAAVRMSNVQCEACHGPQVSVLHGAPPVSPFVNARIDYKAEACGTCHGSGGEHIYSEWATQDAATGWGHSNRGTIALGASATGLSTSCGRCHVAQGYELYSQALESGKVGLTANAVTATITTANAEPVSCVACHDPHDASNPNQLRFYGDTPNLPGGFAGFGLGKGALCVTCHNSRNGAQSGSTTLTYLHEDGQTYNSGNPTGYSAPHQADQGDVFLGRNAYFMGTTLPMLSKHAAIEDTCVGCHMKLNPKGFNGFEGFTASGHLFRINDADQQQLCSNCHGADVNGEGTQAQVEQLLTTLSSKMGAAVKAKANGVAGGIINVTAWDPDADAYSTTAFPIAMTGTAANPVVSVGVEEIHGQVGYLLTFTKDVNVTFASGTKPMRTFGVQMGALKDNQTSPAALFALSGNLVRAGWNYFLIEGDQSKGLHNPTFALGVLNASNGKDLSN